MGSCYQCLLQGAKQFKFGYNFALGKFSRDRQGLIATGGVADNVRQIWQCAVHMHEPTLLPIYVNLLQNFPQVGDIELADRLLEPSTKARIWKYLLRVTERQKFFYSETTSVEVSSQ
jgi:hypothetical protein